ncbi:MAG: hypothetical protein R3Y63_09850 [Eubacteriales bacterium]
MSCRFALETDAEPQAEEQAPTEVSATTKETKQQDLVSSEPPKRKTGKPSPENTSTSRSKQQQEQRHQASEEQHTAETDPQPSEDILQKILNNTYEFNGDEVIYTETAIIYITFPTADEMKPVYVPGFGWVPLPEPSEVIFADDMYQNGNKVGTMGGG